MKRSLLRVGLVVLAVAGFLGLLLWLNPVLRERLRSQPRYQLSFSEIQCPSPPGLTREQFLEEVQYYASSAARLEVLRDDLEEHIKEVFGRHPWVKQVDVVHLLGPKEVRLDLTFRRPVLAVPVGKETRAVDEDGVLLPRNAITMGLPLMSGKAEAPAGAEGTAWGDPNVTKAARKAGRKPGMP